jgi:hypothetical protein
MHIGGTKIKNAELQSSCFKQASKEVQAFIQLRAHLAQN